MKRLQTLFLLWSIALFSLLAQSNLEPKAKQHFLDRNWREASVLFELIHKTNHRFSDIDNYGRAIVAAFQWEEGKRLESFFRIARADSLSFEKIILLSDKAMVEIKNGNQMGNLLFQLIDMEPTINDQFWNAIIRYLNNQREYEKAYRAKQMQVERRTINDTDRLQLASLALNNNQTDVALKYYREVLASDSLQQEANVGLASILYVKGKQLYDRRPQTNHLFGINFEEVHERYVWLERIYEDYFREATKALTVVNSSGSNHYVSEYLKKMSEIKDEMDSLQRKLSKIEKCKRIVPNKKIK